MTRNQRDYTQVKRIGKKEYKYLMRELAPLIDMSPNSEFDVKDILKPIIQASIDNKYIESVCRHLRNNGVTIPTPNDVFYHLAGKKLKMSEVYTCLDSMIEKSLTKARRHINLKSPQCIAIDYHEIPYYGKGNKELAMWICGCENTRGTNKCFKFLTAHIVVRGRRFTIAIIPVNVFDTTHDLLERLISKVRKLIKIQYAFLDRGFDSVDAIKKLIDLGVGFVIPIIKRKGKDNKDIVKLMRDNYYNKNYRFEYTMGSEYNNVTFTVVVKMDEDDKDVIGFATNTRLTTKTIGEWYRKRWGIETGYRVKNEFRARTCSTKPVIRLLLNMLSFVLYNLWALMNTAFRFIIGKGRYLKNDRSYITAYEICKLFEGFIVQGIT